jgi:hypothetical protein
MKNNSFTNNSANLAGGALIENHDNSHTWLYEIDNCLFGENTAPNGGGGLVIRSYPLTNQITGTISNTLFRNNTGNLAAGAFYAYGGIHHITDSDFNLNYTDGSRDTLIKGGGAIVLDGQAEANIERSNLTETQA